MNMKTMYVYLAMGALMCTTTLFAQKPEQKRQQLTPEQRIDSAKFLPLYKEYLQAMAECRPAAPAPAERPRKSELSDEELDKRMQTRFECQKKRIETQETYYAKFKKILTMRQVEKIFAPHPKRFHHAPHPNVSTTRRTKHIALPATDASNMPLCPRICSCDDRI